MILKPPKGAMLNRGHPFCRGLLAYWLLNESDGNHLVDISGNGKPGTNSGADWVGGKFGPALEFNGSSDYVSLGDITDGLAEMTVSVWVWGASGAQSDSYATIFKKGTPCWQLQQNGAANQLFFYMLDASLNSAVCYGSNPFFDGGWHHVVIVWDGELAYLYEDGQLIDSDDGTASGNLRSQSGLSLYMGAENGSENFFAGKIDHAAIWKRILTPNEIKLLDRDPLLMFEVDL